MHIYEIIKYISIYISIYICIIYIMLYMFFDQKGSIKKEGRQY